MTLPENYTPKDDWPIIERPGGRGAKPVGYKNDPDKWRDENGVARWYPDLDVIFFIEQALDFLDNGNGLRPTCEWLSQQLGRSVTHQTLSNIWKRKRGKDKTNRRVQVLKTRKKKRTPEEQAREEARLRLSAARRSLTNAQKNAERVREATLTPEEAEQERLVKAAQEAIAAEKAANTLKVGETPLIELTINDPQAIIPAVPEGIKVVFTPNPGPQTDFLAASEREVLYGGAAGGGKSFAMLADPMRYFDNRNFNGIIFRKTNDELRELKWKSYDLYKAAYADANWKEKDSAWIFPSGARLWFTYLDRDDDVHRYQGQAFSYIGFDELTQYPTPFPYEYMRSRLRTTDPSLPLCMRATSNPGGPGHGWVKRMFIDPAPPNTSFPARDIETNEILTYPAIDRRTGLPHPKAGKSLFNRRFIPAVLYDNPYLMHDDKYETNLLSLPESQRRQFLEGDWDVADGAAFGEFRQRYHTCKPFLIPKTWSKFRSADYGYASHSAVHWYAIDPIYETLFVYRELYTKGKTGKELANMILDLEKDEKILYGVLDSSVWQRRGQSGPSIAEEMLAAGCKWRPSDRGEGSRTAGKNRLHELLKVETILEHPDGHMGRPGIIFFNNCRQIISDLPVIPVDPDGDDDIDKRYTSDHAYDSIRYGIMTRPKADHYWYSGMTTPSYRPSDPILGY